MAFRLIAGLVADAALTVVSCGIYPAIRAGEGERSFIGQALDAMAREKRTKQELEALDKIIQLVKK